MARKQAGRKKRKIALKLKTWQLWASVAALCAGLLILFIAMRPVEPEFAGPAVTMPIPSVQPRKALKAPDPLAPLIRQAEKMPSAPLSAAPQGTAPRSEASMPTAAAKPPSAPEQLALAPPPVPRAPAGHGTRHYEGQPLIAIVLDDVGVDRRRSLIALQLPGPLTFSFMTYAANLPAEIAEAKAHGDAVMVHVPMEPLGRHIDPGPNALLVGQTPAEVTRRLEWGLARVPGATGINNHMGSRFTQWAPGMTGVMSVLKTRGLFFLDSRTTPHSVAAEIARAMAIPTASRDVFLDDEMSASAVMTQLARTEAVARRTGAAIAIGHPHDATIAALRSWLPGLAAKGFKLVPVTALIQGYGETPDAVSSVSQVSAPSVSPNDARAERNQEDD